MPSESPVAPEYRELHEMYCRCAEISEYVLAGAEPHVENPMLGELLGRYAGLSHDLAMLILFLQTRLPADPGLFGLWRAASLASPPASAEGDGLAGDVHPRRHDPKDGEQAPSSQEKSRDVL